MTDLECLIEWLKTYDGYDILGSCQVDLSLIHIWLIHNINRNEYQLAREFELGRMRIAASADLLTAENGRKRLRDDLFVGLEGSEQTVGITAFAPALRNENYEARRQAYLKAVENLLGVKRGILSDAEEMCIRDRHYCADDH